MSALTRYGRPIDGTIPLTALLYDDEWILASQEAVGLYDGCALLLSFLSSNSLYIQGG